MSGIVFMGTPAFAVPTLETLAHSGQDIAGVYTQPDKPVGRGRKVAAPPVKQWAEAHGLRVLQPATLRSSDALEELRSLRPAAIAVVAYGKLLPQGVLDIPPKGVLNLHPSLLPQYRGASPIAAAILNGDSMTGVTIMLLDAGMDTGPILARREVEIAAEDTAESLSGRLATVGAELFAETLGRWLQGGIAAIPQDESRATYTKLLEKGDGVIDWRAGARELERKVRAFYPWPGCSTTWRGAMLKIVRARAVPAAAGSREPGTVIRLPGSGGMEGIGVVTGEGALALDRVQPEGRQEMAAREFVAGRHEFLGARLPS